MRKSEILQQLQEAQKKYEEVKDERDSLEDEVQHLLGEIDRLKDEVWCLKERLKDAERIIGLLEPEQERGLLYDMVTDHLFGGP